MLQPGAGADERHAINGSRLASISALDALSQLAPLAAGELLPIASLGKHLNTAHSSL